MHGDMQNETVQLSYFIFKEILDFKVNTIQHVVIKDKGFIKDSVIYNIGLALWQTLLMTFSIEVLTRDIYKLIYEAL